MFSQPKSKFPLNKKPLILQGKPIDISRVDKSLLVGALYMNIHRNRNVYPLEELEMLHRFKQLNYCLQWFNGNMYVDLSGNAFDPTEYDRLNNTYEREDVQTAYQCIFALREKIQEYDASKAEALRLIKILFNRDDCKFNSEDILYFGKEIKYVDILHKSIMLNELGIRTFAKDGSFGQFKQPHLEINEYMSTIVEKIRQHLIQEAMSENIFSVK